MELFLAGARVALAAVFAFAGVAKAADSRSSALTRSGAVAEMVLAAALLADRTAAWAAACALFVLVGGAAWTLATLARGRRAPCRCFGRWSRAQLGLHQVARNGLLAGMAGLVAGHGSTAAPGLVAWAVAGAIGGVVAVTLAALAYGRRRAAQRLVGRMAVVGGPSVR